VLLEVAVLEVAAVEVIVEEVVELEAVMEAIIIIKDRRWFIQVDQFQLGFSITYNQIVIGIDVMMIIVVTM
jgi:hypothetical protein